MAPGLPPGELRQVPGRRLGAPALDRRSPCFPQRARTGEVEPVQQRLKAHGLKPLVMRGQADLGQPQSVDELAGQLAVCEKMGVHYMFLHPSHTGVEQGNGLRAAPPAPARSPGGTASSSCWRRHPDLGTNADVHRETMRHDRSSQRPGQLRHRQHHLLQPGRRRRRRAEEDHRVRGDRRAQGPRWARREPGTSPRSAQGKIDFAGVLDVLKAHGYAGPITIEVEGVEGKPWNEAQTEQAIADSVAFLRKLAPFQ